MTEPRFVEATGPDVETAIKNGLTRLGADSKDVIVEVLEESSRGLFGIGGHPARVRLTLLAPPEPPKPPTPTEKPAAAAQSEPPKPARRPRKKKKKPQPTAPVVDETVAYDDAAASSVADMSTDAAADTVDDDDLDSGYQPPKTIAPESDDEEARVATETLQELLSKMDIEAEIASYYVEAADENETSPLVLQVTGKDLGTLIGRRGETLASLQYVTRLIVSRELQRRANVIVDVEQYKARREKRLHSLALRMAKQATQRDRIVRLEPMPAYERRIIHLSLRDRTDVFTQSEGEGDARKVTIVPVRDR